jgi:HAD superfamily hydrolase (TIGR01509 family)
VWANQGWRLPHSDRPHGLRAACFDLDGTLVDTGPLHVRAEHAALAALGIPEPSEDHPVTFGHGIMPGMQMLADHYGIESAKRVFDAYLPAWDALFADGIAAKPGADEVLWQFSSMGIPLALVTSGEREYVDKVLARFGWDDLFAHIVTLESVDRLKPDPEPYLLAARLLELRPNQCAGFEDSASGLASLMASAMFAVYVNEEPAPPLMQPELQLKSLLDSRVEDLTNRFTA